MTPVNIESGVRQVLNEITLSPVALDTPSESSLDAVGIDSVGMIDLIYRIEEQFGIQIPDEDVTPENFASIASLVELVSRKCSH